jgi:hypothetical protein
MATPDTILRQSYSIGTRLLCLVGAVFTASIILLALYPGLFTFVAIPVLPAPFLFLAAVIYPALIHKQRLRFYLVGSLVIVTLSWIYEFWWLHHVGATW